MGAETIRIYLDSPQRLDVEGGVLRYSKGYCNAPKELAEKWIGERLAVAATQDNKHTPPEEGFLGQDMPRTEPTKLAPEQRLPKNPEEPKRKRPAPLTPEQKAEKRGEGEKPQKKRKKKEPAPPSAEEWKTEAKETEAEEDPPQKPESAKEDSEKLDG